MKKLLSILFCLPFLITVAHAEFKEGQDYQVITSSFKPKPGKVLVQEFFSYECPWCYRLEPEVVAWQKNKPKFVVFEKVPAIFNPAWEKLSKAFYIFQGMGNEPKMTPLMFKGMQEDRRNFNNGEEIAEYLAPYGLDQKQFLAQFNHEDLGMIGQLMVVKDLQKQYQIMGVPSIVVNGKYVTDLRMTGGDNVKMMQVVTFLANKAKSTSK